MSDPFVKVRAMTGMAVPLRPEKEAPFLPDTAGGFKTVLADPPWRFTNSMEKRPPGHRRLDR